MPQNAIETTRSATSLRRWLQPITLRYLRLADAEGNPRDHFFAEGVLEAVEDFFAAVAYDFVEPRVAVHGDEEGAFVDAGGLRVRGDVRVDQMVPDADNFSFGAPSVHAEAGQDFWHHVAGLLGVELPGLFFGLDVDPAPLGEDAVFRFELWRAAGGNELRIEFQHVNRCAHPTPTHHGAASPCCR